MSAIRIECFIELPLPPPRWKSIWVESSATLLLQKFSTSSSRIMTGAQSSYRGRYTRDRVVLHGSIKSARASYFPIGLDVRRNLHRDKELAGQNILVKVIKWRWRMQLFGGNPSIRIGPLPTGLGEVWNLCLEVDCV